MRVSDTEAAQRVADNDNLVGELVTGLQEAIDLIEAIDGKDNSCDPKSDISDLKALVAKAQGAQQ